MDPIAPPTLSSSGEDAIARCIQVSPDTYSEGRVEEAYEIDWTVAQLHVGNYQRIALQFPDELLHVSVPIYRAIKAKVGAKQEVYILADTTYGSCCVDEVAAQHVDADVIVHYGHACLSPTSRLPVLLRTEGGAPGDLRDDKESDEDSDNPIFSLATGRYRQAKRFVDRTDGTTGSEESTAVILPSKESTVAKFMGSAGGEFLQKRTFQGLEQRLGRDAPSVLEQGRTGIARGYNELESTKLDG
ncbi:Diphthamide biosynthesis protein 2 [Tulasnella sp. 403]|nr:Diphthamide biosynthesis protein 2 [Tulasnella sp. 403]